MSANSGLIPYWHSACSCHDSFPVSTLDVD
jgi:hypothetical protein